MATIFSRIVSGEIPCHRVYEDDAHIAFLDVSPIQPGHTLVVPKREVAYLFAMSPAEQAALWDAVRRVEAGVRAGTGCRRTIVMVVGWEVPHVHVHLVPTNRGDDFPVPPKIPQSTAQLEALARRVSNAVSERSAETPDAS